MTMNGSKVKTVLIIILIAVVIGGAGTLAALLLSDKTEAEVASAVTDELRDAITLNQNDPNPPDFSALQSMNPEIVAWLTIDGTDISHAVTQTSDNDYYLNHSAKRTRSMYGALFLDYRLSKDFSDSNNIIYGHNMQDSAMFGGLMPFKEEAFFDSHQTGWLYTPEKSYRLNIFAVSVGSDTSDAYTWSFESKSVFDEFIGKIKTDALHKRDEPIEWGDKILTMSTCSYEFEEARTVLYAVINVVKN